MGNIETPQTVEEFEAFIAGLTPQEKAYFDKECDAAYGMAIKEDDSPGGFAHFYKLIHGNDLPKHGWRWIEHIYNARKQGRGSLIWAWRGSWKTTTISVTFTAWRIGQDPTRANLIIQANDDSAEDTTAQIADIIKHNEGWKVVFPNIVPDESKGWGANGYEVKDTNMEYEKWRKLNSSRKDPTLLGLGIRSKTLIGKHPDGVLLMDDIHDEENTSSDKENFAVINKVTGTIIPFEVEDDNGMIITWTIAVGTPWRDDDSYHYLLNTGEYAFFKLPIMTKLPEDFEISEDNEIFGVYIDYDGSEFQDLVGKWELSWSERHNWDAVLRRRRVSGKREFHRMYRLDLTASKETGLKYQLYPSDSINYDWVIRAGVDFASVKSRLAAIGSNRDYFAMCWGAKVPTGGVVVMDGVVGHKTQGQGEELIDRMQKMFKNFGYTVIEEDGKGEGFTEILMRKPHLRIHPMKTKGVAKRTRQEKMSPWLEIGIVRISDADTPFLNTLRKALDDYPDGNDDVRDALYWLLRAFPESLIMPSDEQELPNPQKRKTRKKNPFYALAKM